VSVVAAGRQTVTKVESRVRSLVRRARARWPVVDHGGRAVAHYGEVLGSQLAAGVTYFAFLSFFPLIALGFAVVGFVVAYVPAAAEALTSALSEFLPGLVGDGRGQINVEQIASAKAGAGIIGLVGLLYSGLGAVSALRTALHGVFNPGEKEEQRNLVVGKGLDLLVLVVVGLVGVVSVSVGSVVTAMTGEVVAWVGLDDVPGSGLLLWLLASVVGIGSMTLAFFTMYRLLPKNAGRSGDLLKGALIAAVGFEVLKQVAGLLLGQVTSNALYGAFAVMVALLMWMNYTSRLAVLGATWAATATARIQGDDGEIADKDGDKNGDEVAAKIVANPDRGSRGGGSAGGSGGGYRDDPAGGPAGGSAGGSGGGYRDDPGGGSDGRARGAAGRRASDEAGASTAGGIVDEIGDDRGDKIGDKVGHRIGDKDGDNPDDEPGDRIGDKSADNRAGAGAGAADGESTPDTRGRRAGRAIGRGIGGVLGRPRAYLARRRELTRRGRGSVRG
jgi:membrane protein